MTKRFTTNRWSGKGERVVRQCMRNASFFNDAGPGLCLFVVYRFLERKMRSCVTSPVVVWFRELCESCRDWVGAGTWLWRAFLACFFRLIVCRYEMSASGSRKRLSAVPLQSYSATYVLQIRPCGTGQTYMQVLMHLKGHTRETFHRPENRLGCYLAHNGIPSSARSLRPPRTSRYQIVGRNADYLSILDMLSHTAVQKQS